MIRIMSGSPFYHLFDRGDSGTLDAGGCKTSRDIYLTAQGYHRVLKLARTIADLAGSDEIQAQHLAEALQYRPKILS